MAHSSVQVELYGYGTVSVALAPETGIVTVTRDPPLARLVTVAGPGPTVIVEFASVGNSVVTDPVAAAVAEAEPVPGTVLVLSSVAPPMVMVMTVTPPAAIEPLVRRL